MLQLSASAQQSASPYLFPELLNKRPQTLVREMDTDLKSVSIASRRICAVVYDPRRGVAWKVSAYGLSGCLLPPIG